MKQVLIVTPIYEEGINLLKEAGLEVKHLEDPSLESLKKAVVDVDAMIVRTTNIPAEVIECANNLKVIARHGKGVDNIDVEAATKKGIYVTNAPESNINSTAEHVMTLIATVAKNIRQVDMAVRNDRFDLRSKYLGTELNEKILGIVGLGNIGKRLASIAINGFGMKVYAYDPFVKQEDVPEMKLVETVDEILDEADFVSLNVPLNDATRGLIGKEQLKRMKDTAYLINCSRGPVIKTGEVAEGLQENLIAGAAFDVFDQEPPAPDNPLLSLDNVVLTPHLAGLSKTAMRKMAEHAARGVIEVLNNEKPTWPVNQPK